MSQRGRLYALGALWVGVTAGMLAMPGCYGENCNATSGAYGREPGEGRMIDANTWESSPIDGKWLHFPSQHIWYFDVPAWGDRKPFNVLPYISPVEDPNVFHPERAPQNFTSGGGNLTELSGVDTNRLVVRNGTCAEYFLRVVVELPPKPDEVPPPAAQVDASTDASDAGGDAANDGSTDAATD
jgi:hypothetical protein